MPHTATVTAWHLPVRRFVRTSVVSSEVGRMFQMDRVHLMHGGFILGQGCLWNLGIWTCTLDLYSLHV